MFCRKCGAKIPDESEFCPECGTKIVRKAGSNDNNGTASNKASGPSAPNPAVPNQAPPKQTAPKQAPPRQAVPNPAPAPMPNPFPAEPKKKKLWPIFLCMGLVVILIAGACGFLGLQVLKKNKTQQFEQEYVAVENQLKKYSYENISEYKQLMSDCEDAVQTKATKEFAGLSEKLKAASAEIEELHTVIEEAKTKQESLSGATGGFVMDEARQSEYNSLVKKYTKAVDNLDKDSILSLSKELDEFITQLQEENKTKAESSYNSLLNADLTNAYESEKQIIQTYQTQVKEKMDAGDYIGASESLQKWQKVIDSINGQTDYNMGVEQVDVSTFPVVKLYVRVEDKNTGEAIDDLKADSFHLAERMEGSGSFTEKTIIKAVQLDEVENLNINMVADISGSMSGSALTAAKNVMNSFLSGIQFQIGDKASLITFADQVYTNIGFTSDYNQISNTINSLGASGSTAFYDALYVAVNQTAMQSGAKCIIAFTDGQDNMSKCDPAIITELAIRYKIPIFIIGIDPSLDTYTMNSIANSTGGFYRNVNDISDMSEIYSAIYRQQKEMYLLEYETLNPDATTAVRSVTVNYSDDQVTARNAYEFVPAVYMEATVSQAQLFTNDFVIYDSDSRYITAADLALLTQEQLRLARNEIYARRGRLFKDAYLQDYFNQKSWYQGTISPDAFRETMFNDYERANAYFIADYERLKGYLQ